MGKGEDIQELIYTNLSLLKAAGHHIDFKQGMFKEHNLPGFEGVGYALLMIIDPAECKSKIPWPLINDKAQTREFRTNFSRFIKMVNIRYPDAQIPEITASSLQFPGGLKFLYFMYKLSTFVLELELRKVMGPEDWNEFLPKPAVCKQVKDQLIKFRTTTGARYREEKYLFYLTEYSSSTSPILQKMNDADKNITTNNKAIMDILRSEVSGLKVDDGMKKRLLDFEDITSVRDYNERIEKIRQELENSSKKLQDLSQLAVQCFQRGKLCLQAREQTEYLDARNLQLTRSLDKIAGGSVINVDGDVRLVDVLRAAHTAVTRLTKASASSSLQQPAKDLKGRCKKLAAQASKMDAVLQHLYKENKLVVQQLRPILYSSTHKKDIPDPFKHLKERPSLCFAIPNSVSKVYVSVKPGKRRISLNSIILRKKKVVCSFRTKREPMKHVSSTPLFKTPACRKSLYNSLPSGARHKPIDEMKPLEVTPDNPIPLSPVSIQESFVREANSDTSVSTNEPTPAPRCGRKSLNDIVERFLKLKRSMNMSSNSKNESDTCNDSET